MSNSYRWGELISSPGPNHLPNVSTSEVKRWDLQQESLKVILVPWWVVIPCGVPGEHGASPCGCLWGMYEALRDGKQNEELWERIEVMGRLWGRFFPWIFGLRHFDWVFLKQIKWRWIEGKGSYNIQCFEFPSINEKTSLAPSFHQGLSRISCHLAAKGMEGDEEMTFQQVIWMLFEEDGITHLGNTTWTLKIVQKMGTGKTDPFFETFGFLRSKCPFWG